LTTVIYNGPDGTRSGHTARDPATGATARDPATGATARDPATGATVRDPATGATVRDDHFVFDYARICPDMPGICLMMSRCRDRSATA